ncbi:hypothetical protein ACFL59_15585 [Planctomycetota bacterium]
MDGEILGTDPGDTKLRLRVIHSSTRSADIDRPEHSTVQPEDHTPAFRWRTRYLLLLLALLPALGHFLGFYLDGRNVLQGDYAYLDLLSAASMFVLPLPLAAVTAACVGRRLLTRAGLFVVVLALEILAFGLVPPGVRSYTIGVAHRLRQTYSTAMLRSTAERILTKHAEGTLETRTIEEGPDGVRRISGVEGNGEGFLRMLGIRANEQDAERVGDSRQPDDASFVPRECLVAVAESELPEGLRDEFWWVGICRADRHSSALEVRYAFSHCNGIACNETGQVPGFLAATMDEGVHFYRSAGR